MNGVSATRRNRVKSLVLVDTATRTATCAALSCAARLAALAPDKITSWDFRKKAAFEGDASGMLSNQWTVRDFYPLDFRSTNMHTGVS